MLTHVWGKMIHFLRMLSGMNGPNKAQQINCPNRAQQMKGPNRARGPTGPNKIECVREWFHIEPGLGYTSRIVLQDSINLSDIVLFIGARNCPYWICCHGAWMLWESSSAAAAVAIAAAVGLFVAMFS